MLSWCLLFKPSNKRVFKEHSQLFMPVKRLWIHVPCSCLTGQCVAFELICCAGRSLVGCGDEGIRLLYHSPAHAASQGARIHANAGLAQTFSSFGPVEPRNIRETDQPFPEPALFLLNPDGEVVIIDYSNSPFARPDLRILVEGMSHVTSPVIYKSLEDMVRLSS